MHKLLIFLDFLENHGTPSAESFSYHVCSILLIILHNLQYLTGLGHFFFLGDITFFFSVERIN